MAKIVVCDECPTRLDGDLDLQRRHVRITMTISRFGSPDVLIERDLCVDCADDRIAHFEAAPHLVGISGGPR